MKRITFLNKPKQLYYHFRELTEEKTKLQVLILLKQITTIYYDKNNKGIETNVVADCFIEKKDIQLVNSLMKSNAIAIANLTNENNKSIADLAQLKVSYDNIIKPWKESWKIKN